MNASRSASGVPRAAPEPVGHRRSAARVTITPRVTRWAAAERRPSRAEAVAVPLGRRRTPAETAEAAVRGSVGVALSASAIVSAARSAQGIGSVARSAVTSCTRESVRVILVGLTCGCVCEVVRACA